MESGLVKQLMATSSLSQISYRLVAGVAMTVAKFSKFVQAAKEFMEDSRVIRTVKNLNDFLDLLQRRLNRTECKFFTFCLRLLG